MADQPLRRVRSILESPILNARKWAKVPGIPVDGVLLDLEDSVPEQRKDEARAKVVAQLANLAYLGGRVPIPRVNALDTPYGEADLRAVAEAGAQLIAYPKVHTAAELDEAHAILRDAGADPQLVPVIETARAVLELDHIAARPYIGGMLFGPFDLGVDAGITPFDGPALFGDAYHYAKSKLVLTGAAFEVPVFDFLLTPQLRDVGQVASAVDHARRMGFDGMVSFYPPHVEVINTAFTPTADAVAHARQVVQVYEAALGAGNAAAQIDGKAVIVQDYKRALRTLKLW
ncbi:MAG: HpcH/HpaI aldolase/citrate lyase family protein [Mycobacterium sp.]